MPSEALTGDIALQVLLGASILYPTLVALAVIDRKHLRLPDRGTLPLLGTGLLWSAWAEAGWPVSAIAAAACGYGAFALFGAVFHRLRGQEGLGLGDAKLIAAGGAWLGLAYLPWIVLFGASGALAFALTRGQPGPLAFGPWIAAAIGGGWAVRAVNLWA